VVRQNGIIGSLTSLLGIEELTGILSSSVSNVNESERLYSDGLCDGEECTTKADSAGSKDNGHRNLRGGRRLV